MKIPDRVVFPEKKSTHFILVTTVNSANWDTHSACLIVFQCSNVS